MAKDGDLRRVGRAVAARRGELGLTQQDLADAAGVDLKTVYNLESGTRWPIAKTRAAITAALGWPPDALGAIAVGEESGGTVSVPPARTAPPDRKLPVLGLDPGEEEALQPYLLELTRELYAAAGLQLGPGREVPDLPEVEELISSLPGSRIFRADYEVRIWDTIVLNAWEKRRLIATLRMWGAEAAGESGERNAV